MSNVDLLARIGADLDSNNPLPLYQQLTLSLRHAIESGALAPGDALPPEQQLAQQLHLSRQTVNLALTNLARRGLVYRKRGTGTFVAEPFVEQGLGGLYSFIHTLESQGRLPSSKLLGFQALIDDRASPLLAGSPDGLVYEIKRLRLVDGEPFAIETTYVPSGCGDKLPVERLEKDPLYDLLEEFCGLRVAHAEETLRPITIERAEAQLLGVSADEPAFLVERIGYAAERPVELRISLIRGDRYRFKVRLERTSDGLS
jgi:GntR family transcriptional regulator